MSTLFSNYFKSLEKVMQKEGLEHSWYHYHTDLNSARLTIQPFLRTNVYYNNRLQMSTLFFELFKLYAK